MREGGKGRKKRVIQNHGQDFELLRQLILIIFLFFVFCFSTNPVAAGRWNGSVCTFQTEVPCAPIKYRVSFSWPPLCRCILCPAQRTSAQKHAPSRVAKASSGSAPQCLVWGCLTRGEDPCRGGILGIPGKDQGLVLLLLHILWVCAPLYQRLNHSQVE